MFQGLPAEGDMETEMFGLGYNSKCHQGICLPTAISYSVHLDECRCWEWLEKNNALSNHCASYWMSKYAFICVHFEELQSYSVVSVCHSTIYVVLWEKGKAFWLLALKRTFQMTASMNISESLHCLWMCVRRRQECLEWSGWEKGQTLSKTKENSEKDS